MLGQAESVDVAAGITVARIAGSSADSPELMAAALRMALFDLEALRSRRVAQAEALQPFSPIIELGLVLLQAVLQALATEEAAAAAAQPPDDSLVRAGPFSAAVAAAVLAHASNGSASAGERWLVSEPISDATLAALKAVLQGAARGGDPIAERFGGQAAPNVTAIRRLSSSSGSGRSSGGGSSGVTHAVDTAPQAVAALVRRLMGGTALLAILFNSNFYDERQVAPPLVYGCPELLLLGLLPFISLWALARAFMNALGALLLVLIQYSNAGLPQLLEGQPQHVHEAVQHVREATERASARAAAHKLEGFRKSLPASLEFLIRFVLQLAAFGQVHRPTRRSPALAHVHALLTCPSC